MISRQRVYTLITSIMVASSLNAAVPASPAIDLAAAPALVPAKTLDLAHGIEAFSAALCGYVSHNNLNLCNAKLGHTPSGIRQRKIGQIIRIIHDLLVAYNDYNQKPFTTHHSTTMLTADLYTLYKISTIPPDEKQPNTPITPKTLYPIALFEAISGITSALCGGLMNSNSDLATARSSTLMSSNLSHLIAMYGFHDMFKGELCFDNEKLTYLPSLYALGCIIELFWRNSAINSELERQRAEAERERIRQEDAGFEQRIAAATTAGNLQAAALIESNYLAVKQERARAIERKEDRQRQALRNWHDRYEREQILRAAERVLTSHQSPRR